MKREKIRQQLINADIYGLTAAGLDRGRGNVETVRQLIAAGVGIIQYREKDKPAGQRYEECRKIRAITRQAGVGLLIDDYVDLALAVEADGVHIGQDDLPPAQVRKLVGEDMLIGLSTHCPDQARAAEADGIVDYIGVGPIYPTKTKRDVCEPVGLTYLDYVVENISLPFVAIGGIKEANIREVYCHGARIIALVSEIVGATDIPAKVRKLRRVMTGENRSLP